MNALYLLNRDLRLKDNKTLLRAAQESQRLEIVYALDQLFFDSSPAQKLFIKESLENLSFKLQKMGVELKVFRGERKNVLDLSESVDAVYVSKVYNYKDQKKQDILKQEVLRKGASFQKIENSLLYELENLPFDLAGLPRVFTAFRKKIEKKELDIFCCENVNDIPKGFLNDLTTFEDSKDWFDQSMLKNHDFHGGEDFGRERLKHYLWTTDAAQTYKETRNGLLKFDDSTKFSPWLAVGALSPREIMVELKQYEVERGANESTYWIYFELMWREYFKLYSLKYGGAIFELGGIQQKKVQNAQNQKELFEKWSKGQTGLDFINANMNELNTSGWMSNRGRQNVASYLSKELNVDWRWGAEWFAKNLIDYDVESNWGNWNYNAGVGVDPRDRKFNIQRQAQMYDPDGEYVSKFLDPK